MSTAFLADLIIILAKILIVFVVLSVLVVFIVWFERKVVAHMQSRLGPNRWGPFGLLTSVADGMKLLHDICEIYAVQGYTSNVLAASLRHPMHVVDAALAGADIATMPYDVFTKLVKHPLTDLGMERFQADWEKLQHLLEGEAST